MTSAVGSAGAALAARDVTVRYGGVTAIDRVTIDVAAGEVTGLIGPNGAGKTTLIDALSGFVAPDAGTVCLDAEPIDRLKPHQRARRGLSRTFQQLELFTQLTVRENIAAAVRATGRSREGGLERAVDAVGLGPVLEQPVAQLPQGRRRLVAVARAVATGPRVLLLDEPVAGLDTDESTAVGHHIRQLSDDGMAILLVDHDMSFVLSTCHRIVVLDFGTVLATGSPEQIRDDAAVIAAYLGES